MYDGAPSNGPLVENDIGSSGGGNDTK